MPRKPRPLDTNRADHLGSQSASAGGSWSDDLIAKRRLEERIDEKLDQFCSVLDGLSIHGEMRRKLMDLVADAVNSMGEIAIIRLNHVKESNKDAQVAWESMRHFSDKIANYQKGFKKTRDRKAERHKAMDEGWNAGYTTKTSLLDFMKQQEQYRPLIYTHKKPMSEDHIWADYLRHRRETRR